MHAYPKARWEREGSLPFDQWGAKTDGEGTPWAEWYDADKLIDALKPARFELVYYCEYRKGDMDCIDLVRAAAPEQALPPGAVLLARGDMLHADSFWEGASVQPSQDGLNVITVPICWGYSAQIPLLPSDADVPPGKRFRLCAKASVQRGEIGIGIPSRDGSRFLAELRFDPRSDREQVSAEVDDLDIGSVAIVRNACRDNQPSSAIVAEVRLYRC